MRTTDDTGLCAPDCACHRCEAGFRPTELERAAARRALAARQILKDASKTAEHKGPRYHRLAPVTVAPMPAPYTEEQKAELDRLAAERRRAWKR